MFVFKPISALVYSFVCASHDTQRAVYHFFAHVYARRPLNRHVFKDGYTYVAS